MQLRVDGTKIYSYPDKGIADILFNGNSILELAPECAMIWPGEDSYGCVIVRKATADAAIKKYIDGTYRQYLWYGKVEVIEE